MLKINDYSIQKNPLIKYSFNTVYDCNSISVFHKTSPKITTHILVSHFVFDLSSLQTTKFEKKITQAGLKKKLGQEFASSCQIQTTQFVLHCLSHSLFRGLSPFARGNSNNPLLLKGPGVFTRFPPKGAKGVVQPSCSKEGVKRYLSPQRAYGTSYFFDFCVAQINGKNKKTNFKKHNILLPTYTLATTSNGLSCASPVKPFALAFKDKNRVATFALAKAREKVSNIEETYIYKKLKKNNSFVVLKWHQFFGSGLMSARWVLKTLVDQLSVTDKRSPRPIVNQFINDTNILMKNMGSTCPILGLKITMTGRLGSQKKGMAQQINRSIGKVPLSSFRQNVDYSQSFITTRLGAVGIKIWVCYR